MILQSSQKQTHQILTHLSFSMLVSSYLFEEDIKTPLFVGNPSLQTPLNTTPSFYLYQPNPCFFPFLYSPIYSTFFRSLFFLLGYHSDFPVPSITPYLNYPLQIYVQFIAVTYPQSSPSIKLPSQYLPSWFLNFPLPCLSPLRNSPSQQDPSSKTSFPWPLCFPLSQFPSYLQIGFLLTQSPSPDGNPFFHPPSQKSPVVKINLPRPSKLSFYHSPSQYIFSLNIIKPIPFLFPSQSFPIQIPFQQYVTRLSTVANNSPGRSQTALISGLAFMNSKILEKEPLSNYCLLLVTYIYVLEIFTSQQSLFPIIYRTILMLLFIDLIKQNLFFQLLKSANFSAQEPLNVFHLYTILIEMSSPSLFQQELYLCSAVSIGLYLLSFVMRPLDFILYSFALCFLQIVNISFLIFGLHFLIDSNLRVKFEDLFIDHRNNII